MSRQRSPRSALAQELVLRGRLQAAQCAQAEIMEDLLVLRYEGLTEHERRSQRLLVDVLRESARVTGERIVILVEMLGQEVVARGDDA